jgi:hypothetical protein
MRNELGDGERSDVRSMLQQRGMDPPGAYVKTLGRELREIQQLTTNKIHTTTIL